MKDFSTFIVVESQIGLDENLTNTSTLLYFYIAGLAMKTGKCFASNETLQKLIRSKTRNLQQCLKELADRNYILIEKINGKRVITPVINKFLEERAEQNSQNVFNYDWLNSKGE